MNSVLWPILRKAMMRPTRIIIKDDQRKWRYVDLIGGAYFLAKRKHDGQKKNWEKELREWLSYNSKGRAKKVAHAEQMLASLKKSK